MDEKKKNSAGRELVQKWQLILQWICAAVWIIVVIVDILYDQQPILMVMQCVAAILFTAAAIVTTVRYREAHHD